MKFKYKKLLFLATLFSCFGLFTTANAQSSVQSASVSNHSPTGKTERGKSLLSDYLCLENLNFGPEIKHISKNKELYYTKNIVINKEISKIEDNTSLSSGSKINLDITFTYDKESFVKINDLKNDIKISKSSDNWKIGDLTEVFPGKDSCLVSTTYSVIKKSITGLGDRVLDGHVDVMCSKYGDIGLDTELD